MANGSWYRMWYERFYRACRVSKGHHAGGWDDKMVSAIQYAYANRHRPKLFVAPDEPPYPDRLLEMQCARRYFFRRLEVLRRPDKRTIREFLRYRYGLEQS